MLNHTFVLRLVNAPAIEAAEIVEKLAAKDARLGLTLTALRKYIKVRAHTYCPRIIDEYCYPRKNNLQQIS